MAQIGGDAGSAEWKSSRQAARGKVKAAWLADAIARAESKRKALTAENAEKNSGKAQNGLLEVSLKRRALRSCMKRLGTAHRAVPHPNQESQEILGELCVLRDEGSCGRRAEAHAHGDPSDAGHLYAQGLRQSRLALRD
jgi:hypothetical protein